MKMELCISQTQFSPLSSPRKTKDFISKNVEKISLLFAFLGELGGETGFCWSFLMFLVFKQTSPE
jgi:hypothetical protein